MVCAIALSPVAMPTAAVAAIPVPTADLEAICLQTTIMNPNYNSSFTISLTQPVQSTVGAEYEKSRVVTLNIPGGILISSVGPNYIANTQGRNGQSPNIFGSFETVQTFTGGTLVQQVTFAQDTTFTFGCTVSKIVGGKVNAPKGLQVTGLTATRSEVTRTLTDEVRKPDVVVKQISESVICNSPTKNPGVWRNQNGYTGICSTALFNSLSQVVIHSNSLPPLEPITLPAAHDSTRTFTDSSPATVVDEWTDEPAS